MTFYFWRKSISDPVWLFGGWGGANACWHCDRFLREIVWCAGTDGISSHRAFSAGFLNVDFRNFTFFIFSIIIHVFNSLLHVECLEVFITGTLASVNQVSHTSLLKLIFVDSTMLCEEFFDSPVTTANPYYNSFAFNFHEYLLSSESIYTRSLSFKLHFTTEAKRCLVDKVSQVSVNGVVMNRLVKQQLVFNCTLNIFHVDLQALNCFIFRLAASQ